MLRLEPAAVLDGTRRPMRGQTLRYYIAGHPPPSPGSGWRHLGAQFVVAPGSYR